MDIYSNQGVGCSVKACKYNRNGNICVLQRIMVTSDSADKHYCGSFEVNSDIY